MENVNFVNLKLPIEVVPETSHYKNLRYILTPKEWKQLRKQFIEPLNNKCQICGGKSPKRSLDLHEVWSYNKETGIQKLERLEGLCIYCHEVKHYFLTNIQGNYERARKRLKKINSFSDQEVIDYEAFIIKDFKENSKIKWSLDISLISE